MTNVMTTELKLLGVQKVDDMEFNGIEGGFGENSKSMLVKDIAILHGRKLKHINEVINNNRIRFIDNVDIIDIKGNDIVVVMTDHNIFSKMQVAKAENIYILSEKGYTKLLKILDDEFAWEQYNKLMDNYFSMRKELFKSIPRTYGEALYEAGRLALDNEYKDKLLEKARPILDKYGAFLGVEDTYTFEEASKMLSTRGDKEGSKIKVNKKTLTSILRDCGIISKNKIKGRYKNLPNKGFENYFNISCDNSDREDIDSELTRVKTIGIDYIYDILLDRKEKGKNLVVLG